MTEVDERAVARLEESKPNAIKERFKAGDIRLLFRSRATLACSSKHKQAETEMPTLVSNADKTL